MRARRQLVVGGEKGVAHFRIQVGYGKERVRHFASVRRDQIHAAITRNHLLVFGELALVRRLAVQLRAQIFGARKLRGSGLPLAGFVVGIGITWHSHSWLCSGEFTVGKLRAKEGKSCDKKKWRNGGEGLVQ